MTNNHVLESPGQAASAIAEFDFMSEGADGLKVRFLPKVLFITEAWKDGRGRDYTLWHG